MTVGAERSSRAYLREPDQSMNMPVSPFPTESSGRMARVPRSRRPQIAENLWRDRASLGIATQPPIDLATAPDMVGSDTEFH